MSTSSSPKSSEPQAVLASDVPRRWGTGGLEPGKTWGRGKTNGAHIPGRGKSARVINYEEFKKALEELAMKRFKGKSKEEAFDAICQLVAGKEPANVGVTVSILADGDMGNHGWGWRAGFPNQASLGEQLYPNRKQRQEVLWNG